MAMFFAAMVSELTSRSMSFLIEKFTAAIAEETLEETLSSLQRLLLRVHVIVEEAEQRHITNQAMLRQLNQMRMEMYRGYHKLDVFRCRDHEETARDQRQAAMVLKSFTPSRFNPAKRLCFSSGGSISSSEQDRLREVLVGLAAMVRDASELALFLSGCPPRRCRQPYSTYLILDNSMFGRQMEMERIMEFLLQEEAPIDGNLGVLPIFGTGRVGKSTLIEHACNNERVRDHFSQIMCFSQCSITDDRTVAALSDCDVIQHRGRASGEERVLVIIQLTGDIDENVWRKFYSDCKHHAARGSKIILASRSDKIARLGTTQPLKVQVFTPEVYWYFFKVRTFGSTDTRDHPKLVSIAMDLAQEMNGCFFGATVFSGLLKANFDAHFWSMALATAKDFNRVNRLLFGEKCADLWQVSEPVYVRRVSKFSSEYIVVRHDCETASVQEPAQIEGPQMSIGDLLFGNNARPHGMFNVLAWRSHLPPHYSYKWNCDVVHRPRRVVSRKKPIQQILSK